MTHENLNPAILSNKELLFHDHLSQKRPPERFSWTNAVRQTLAACIINLVVIQAGINMAYSAIMLPQMQGLTKSEESWIASTVTIILPLGSLIAGPCMDRFGRKKLALFSCICFFIAWLLVANHSALWMIFLARAVSGTAGGLTTVGLVYVSEITHTQMRPMLMCFNSVAVAFGILTTYVAGALFEYRTVAFIFCGLSVLSFVAILFVPESPYWLAAFGEKDRNAAKKALRWLYREETIHRQALAELDAGIDPSKATNGKGHAWNVYRERRVYRPILVLVVLFVLQQLSGAYVIIFYAVDMFMKIGGNFGNHVDPYIASVALGVIRFIMSIVISILSRYLGRRTLMFVSGLGMTASALVVGLCMHYTPTSSAVLLTFVLLYVLFSALGYLTIPWTLIGELLPLEVKGTQSGVLVAVAYIMMTAVVKSYPSAVEVMGAEGLFFLFAGTSLMGVLFVYAQLPETKDKGLREIENYFTR